MSRRKARKPRRQRSEGAGKVTIRIECGPGATVEVVLPGYTGDDYRQAKEKAQAGDYRAPEIWRLIRAVDAAVDHEGAAPLDPSLWGDADFLKVLAYLGLVDKGEWGAADDAAVAAWLGGEGADDGR
ncbi:hypothetical protein [Streptomyces shenzhenensis]|uniref:hypothetical protein n=1 Tax=Streptomyces shenzhenensis TaxID=943815 RepID=UPI001F15D7A8|nr:hypothetical protein [Streptomyces shenzhenensis]